jgi:glycosyltransferase involved in cell wall biosynthesis
MSMPPLAVLVVTYQRASILAQTLEGLRAFLRYDGPMRLVVADDGSTDETHSVAEAYGGLLVVSNRGGLGANTNAGLLAALEGADLVLQLQDDMQPLCRLDLTPHAAWLLEHPEDGFIRLWGVGGHKYTATLDDRYWRISWDSDELYIASDRPHLKHRRFVDAVGLYPEGLPTARTEEAFCHQAKDAGKVGAAPAVLVPHAVDVERNFEHLGWHSRWRDKGL